MSGTMARMLALTMMSAALLVPPADGQGLPIRTSGCLHDQGETAPQRGRREGALGYLKAINTAQGALVQRSKRYGTIQQLGTLPPVPEGFVVRLYSDAEGYLVSIKDDRDPCRYALFSDNSGHVYEAKMPAPQIAS